MSRHRGVRNRQFSYDDNEDDYYDEEDDTLMDEDHKQYMRNRSDNSAGVSLSSYFDVPSVGRDQGGQLRQEVTVGSGGSDLVDDELIADIAAELGRRLGAGRFPSGEVARAVISSGYEVDIAEAILLSSEISTTVEPSNKSLDVPVSTLPPSSLAFGLRVDGRGHQVAAGESNATITQPLPPPIAKSDAGGASAVEGDAVFMPVSISGSTTSTVRTFQFDTPSPDDLALARQARAGRGGVGVVSRKGGAGDRGLEFSSDVGSGKSVKGNRDRVSPGKKPAQHQFSTSMVNQSSSPTSGTPSQDQTADGALPASGGGTNLSGSGASVVASVAADFIESGESDVEDSVGKGKERLAMVVVGHVDAGKSTLMGQVLVKLGQVSQRALHKQEKEAKEAGKASFFLAWVMDEDQEERVHGVTIDVAQKHVETKTKLITLLDAPGHRDFIPKMIGGATAADAAVLVVPATPGEFESGFEANGQTKEHAMLVKALGVNQLLVVVNKLDAADPPWSQERYRAVRAKVEPFLASLGFRPRKVRFVPASGLTGENVAARGLGEALSKWYDGPTLLEAMDAFVPAPRLTEKPFRMCVADVSGGKGATVLVSGRIVQGRVRVGDKVRIMPLGDLATIVRLERNGTPAQACRAGDNADVSFGGVDAVRLTVGNVVCRVGKGSAANRLVVPVARRFDAQIVTLGALQVPIIKGTEFQLHMHNLDVMVHCSKLVALTSSSGDVLKAKPRCVLADTNAHIRLSSMRPLCLEKYGDCRPLGRFVLRQKGVTVAVGLVLNTDPR